MSTKSTIISVFDVHIYEETNQPQYVFGKFVGFDIEMVIDKPSVSYFKLDHLTVSLRFTNGCELKELLPDGLILNAFDLTNIEMDQSDLMITVKGGTGTAEKIKKLTQ